MLNGLMVPKVEGEESILHLHDRLCTQKIRRQPEPIPVLDQQRLQALAFGAMDYTSDLGIAITFEQKTSDSNELEHLVKFHIVDALEKLFGISGDPESNQAQPT